MSGSIDWDKYIGRTTYANIISLEAEMVPACDVPLCPRDFSVEAVMAIPMESVRIDGRIGEVKGSTFIVAPEILKVISLESPVQMVFKAPRGRQSLELWAHPDNSAVVLAKNSVLQVQKKENEMPLDFRLDISEALVVMK